MLDNNVSSRQQQIQQQFQALTPQQQEEIRQQIAMGAMPQVNPELLTENIQDTYVANRVANTTDDPKGMLWTAGLAIPSWFAIAKGMDKFAEKCRGDYEKTVPGKMGAWGDKVAEKFGKSRIVNWIGNGYKKFTGFFKRNVVDKSAILRAFRDTPSRPDLSMVKVQMDGMLGFLGDAEYKQHIEGFLKPRETVDGIACYGAEAADIAKYKAEFANAATPEARRLVLDKAEFETLSKYSKNNPLSGSALANKLNNFAAIPEHADRLKILNELKAVEAGHKNYAELKNILAHPEKYFPEITKACHNANPKMYYMAYEPGSIKDKVFGRKVYFSETSNKMVSSLGEKVTDPKWERVLKETGLDKKIPKSKLGRFITKYNNIMLEGATNRVAGGKLIAIMQAWFIAEAIYKTAKADGVADKARTFAERITELVAMFACIPPAIMLMHKVGGLQYAGMDKAAVEAYRKALNEHDIKSMSGKFENELAHSLSVKNLEKQLNAGVKNPITKFFKRIGRIVSVGLEQIRPYDAKDIGIIKDGEKVYRKGIGAKLKDLWRHPIFGLKQMAGYPMRLALGMMVIMPFFSKFAVKCCHKIFGKPKNSVLDEDKEPKPEEMPQNQQPQVPPQLQQTAMNSQQSNTTFAQNPNYPRKNLLDKYKNQQNSTIINNTTTINNSSTETKPEQKEPLRTYIPSPIGVQLTQGEDMTEAARVMQQADWAEQQALRTLKMN